VRAILDTHAFIVLSREGLGAVSVRAQRVIQDEDTDLILSTVSITEIAIKSNINKLEMTREVVSVSLERLRLTILPYEVQHSIRLFDLPLHHRDPFDRMLIATALAEGLPIITEDREFRKYKGLSVIW